MMRTPVTIPPLPRPDTLLALSLISSLDLSAHPEGGYFRRLHVSPAPSSSSSSSIHYLLTPSSPIGHFHRNRNLTYHFWHRGRGRYVLIDPETGETETFAVGGDGGRIMWVVEGGVWKASFLEEGEEALLISEVVVPEWTVGQHQFMDAGTLEGLVGGEQAGVWQAFLKERTDGEYWSLV